MAENTKIEWADHTFNPWQGCTKVGPGCDHCYAEARNNRFGGGNWGPAAPRDRHSDAYWRKPLAWNGKRFFQCGDCRWRGHDPVIEGSLQSGLMERLLSCPECGSFAVGEARRRVFCASLADWLDNEVPIEWLADLLLIVSQTPNLDWLLLTKRIGNWRTRLDLAFNHFDSQITGDTASALRASSMVSWLGQWLQDGEPPENVWIGATVVNQEEADRDIPKLLAVPAAIRFLSMEPMLGPVDLQHVHLPAGFGRRWIDCLHDWYRTPDAATKINWVICGGESGPGARPMHPDWVRSLRDQCLAADTPFLFKQWGHWRPCWPEHPGLWHHRANPKCAIACIDGGARPFNTAGGAPQDVLMRPLGKKVAGRLLDGRTWDGFPTGEDK